MMRVDPDIQLSTEVGAALQAGWPIVALESTVIAHGLPYPSNVETALELEKIVRDAGVTPATVAVLGGRMCVGLSRDEIEHLGRGDGILKLGTRDLPGAIAGRKDGATTVSATAHISAMAGIRVFATGGIGGVHRGADRLFDISSDLWELANTSIIVVCAGAKAILDLPATLEWLETHQVPVYGYGTDEFPAFYSRGSGLHVERVDSPSEVAERSLAQRALELRGGMLVAVPIPEESELRLDDMITRALSEAESKGVKGKEVTPWLLGRLDELTGGKSVEANVALLRNNVSVASEIARVVDERLSDMSDSSNARL